MRMMKKVRVRFCLLDLQLHGSPHDLTAPLGMLGLAAHVRGRRRRGRGVVEEYPQLLRGECVVDDGYCPTVLGRADARTGAAHVLERGRMMSGN